MPRGARTGPPGTDDLLKQLNVDFQRSKTEQIQRFLVDQESLNRKFAEYDLNSDESGGESGGSDTESVYSQRMALYKARPESVLGGVTLDQLFHREDDAASNTSTQANFSDSDDEGHAGKDAVYDRNRNLANRNGVSVGRGTNRDPRSVRAQREHNNTQEGGGNAPVRQEKKLLVRRHIRPRTATGITSVQAPPQNSVTTLVDKFEKVKDTTPEVDKLPVATPRLRASAPAASRTRPTLEGDAMEKEHVVERSSNRKSLLRESKTISSYRDAFNTPAGGAKGVTVPSITRGERSKPSYARVPSARAQPTTTDAPPTARDLRNDLRSDTRPDLPMTSRGDPRASISSGNTRLTQPRPTASFQATPDSRATRTVHRVGSTNVSTVHTQRDSSLESRGSRGSRTTVLRMGDAGPVTSTQGERRREGFRGSTVRQSSRDRETRERSRERRSGITSTRTSTTTTAATDAFSTQETTAGNRGNRHVTVLKLPPLEGGMSKPGRGVGRDQPV